MERIEYEFDPEKNRKLKEERGISFEEIIYYIDNGYLLETIQHHNQEKYIGQKFYVVDVENYIYLVPSIRQNDKIFLKTIFPSRKHTKQYLEKGKSRRKNHE